MKSGAFCFLSGVTLTISAFASESINYIFAVASYTFMFIAYVIRDSEND